jgi:hypothetical protein
MVDVLLMTMQEVDLPDGQIQVGLEAVVSPQQPDRFLELKDSGVV